MALLVRPELESAPYRILAAEADVALGTVAGCMNNLERRGLLQRRGEGRYVVDRPQLVALWVQAYVEVLRPKLRVTRLQMRTDAKPDVWAILNKTLTHRGVKWALTGADAAEIRTHFYRAEETEIYVPLHALEDRALQRELIAQPVARVGNLWAIELPGPLAIPAARREGIPVAPDLLVYAELRHRGTGQALEAAEMLLPAVLGKDVR
jgi:hypothetical protein